MGIGEVRACRRGGLRSNLSAIDAVAGKVRKRVASGSLRGDGPGEIHGGFGDLVLNRRDRLRDGKHACPNDVRIGGSPLLREARSNPIRIGCPGMRLGFRRGNRVGEANLACNQVIAHQSAWNGVDNAKRLRIGGSIRLPGATNNFDGGSSREFLSRDGFCGESKNKLHAITRLAGRKIGNSDGDRRRRRNGLAGSAAASQEKCEDRNSKIEEGNSRRFAFRADEVHRDRGSVLPSFVFRVANPLKDVAA